MWNRSIYRSLFVLLSFYTVGCLFTGCATSTVVQDSYPADIELKHFAANSRWNGSPGLATKLRDRVIIINGETLIIHDYLINSDSLDSTKGLVSVLQLFNNMYTVLKNSQIASDLLIILFTDKGLALAKYFRSSDYLAPISFYNYQDIKQVKILPLADSNQLLVFSLSSPGPHTLKVYQPIEFIYSKMFCIVSRGFYEFSDNTQVLKDLLGIVEVTFSLNI